MARADFPQDWPNLFHDLLAQLSHEAQQQQHQSLAKTRRVYLVLHNLLKVGSLQAPDWLCELVDSAGGKILGLENVLQKVDWVCIAFCAPLTMGGTT
eukprot:scaffold213011_cov21-Tisochrysis_lutea.AAC.1